MIIPDTTPIKYNIPVIFIFSLIFSFTLNNINIPIPEPTNNPPIIEPTEITFCKYSCVNITDDAQFGIKPTIPAINGPTTGMFNIKFDIFSSPIKYIATFITNEIIIMNIKMFNVCFIEDFNIPSFSQ